MGKCCASLSFIKKEMETDEEIFFMDIRAISGANFEFLGMGFEI